MEYTIHVAIFIIMIELIPGYRKLIEDIEKYIIKKN